MERIEFDMNELMKKIGERMKELRKRKKWTQEELAHLLDVAPSSVGSYERGSRQPTMENLIRMSQYFNVSLDYIFCQTDDIRTIENLKREDSKELIDLLKNQSVMFAGIELNENDKQRVIDILSGLFWDEIINKSIK